MTDDRATEAPPTSYCDAVRRGLPDPHRDYHDRRYGFPLDGDAALFGRLVLEINQAGLSWTTILRKEAAFERAYDGFDVDRVAGYGDADVARLLADASIVRNRLKVRAAVTNAQRIVALRTEFGGLQGWLEAHHPLPLDAWLARFKATFTFVGPEIVREFLVSTGYLDGAHDPDCPVRAHVLEARPPWARNG